MSGKTTWQNKFNTDIVKIRGEWDLASGGMYQVAVISVRSLFLPGGCFLSSFAKSSFMNPSELLDWVRFLLDGKDALRFAWVCTQWLSLPSI